MKQRKRVVISEEYDPRQVLKCCDSNFVYKNWPETFTEHPKAYFEPQTREELQEILKYASVEKKRVSFVGNSTSPSDLPCNHEIMISMKKFCQVLEINKDEMYVHAEAGIFLSKLNEELHKNGMALECSPTIDYITLGGAISTASHGTGIRYGILSAHVIEITMLYQYNTIRTISEESDPDLFRAACVSLGFLGPILSLKIQIVPAFKLTEEASPDTLENVLKDLERDITLNDRYRFMYYPTTGKCMKYKINPTKKPVDDPQHWFYQIFCDMMIKLLVVLGYLFPSLLKKINKFSFEHFRAGTFTRTNHSHKILIYDILCKMHVLEYSFPIEKTKLILRKLDKLVEERGISANAPAEVRFVKGDDLLISTNTGNNVMTHINVISYLPFGFNCPKKDLWECFEGIMKEVGGRPHWGKLHRCSHNMLASLYGENFELFKKIKNEADPDNLFINEYFLRSFKDTDSDELILKNISFDP